MKNRMMIALIVILTTGFANMASADTIYKKNGGLNLLIVRDNGTAEIVAVRLNRLETLIEGTVQKDANTSDFRINRDEHQVCPAVTVSMLNSVDADARVTINFSEVGADVRKSCSTESQISMEGDYVHHPLKKK